jgi:hypothetical protein
MVAVRKEHLELGCGSMIWVETRNPSVAAFVRELAGDHVLVLSNLVAESQAYSLPAAYHGGYRDLISNAQIAVGDASSLPGYAFAWLKPLG